ncbi:MAG: CHAD domain-containing protein [Polaromonas sp.]|nr:CHAD domain-containing protein [Polaromonas sp.]
MKPDTGIRQPQEIELKLALPGTNLASLRKRLARVPALARHPATQQHLHNIYYDTPDQRLNRERIALRLRRTGSTEDPVWLQTLKTGGRSDSALSQRGEWESSVHGPTLERQALQATPWLDLDPDGALFQTLAPCFVTIFERTCWTVRRRDGSLIEVALDIGQIEAGGNLAPLCELELELLAGQPAALFDLARQIARSIAVLPETRSKAVRGYALARGELHQPLRARPPKLTPHQSLGEAAQSVLREAFCQFTSNLQALRASDEPEVVHQARVGWRRFRTALRLFLPALNPEALPSLQPLHTLLTLLGELRDLDVASTDTLPPLAQAYTAADASRENHWQNLQELITESSRLQRTAVRYALQTPAAGAALLAITQWLESGPALAALAAPAAPAPKATAQAKAKPLPSLRRWAKKRSARLHEKLKIALQDLSQPDSQHRARILAKRMRYSLETLAPLLKKRRAQRWQQQALALQTNLGSSRDLQQAAVLAAKLEAAPGLSEFLRGFAAGQA